MTQGSTNNCGRSGTFGGETPSDSVSGDFYAKFDPIVVLLDMHWTLSRLSAEKVTSPSENKLVPKYSAPLASAFHPLADASSSNTEVRSLVAASHHDRRSRAARNV